ncbi:hypothetical protein F383_09323 [Gossypium arboreum]|uniref:Uncharacterized protein n=1 Tax=Gossypium arboreum TaxID=29729 RepID=A0A0B0NM55_GOSAR|nr:hypothetical protein F383_09323 [Gossypium arboreum]
MPLSQTRSYSNQIRCRGPIHGLTHNHIDRCQRPRRGLTRKHIYLSYGSNGAFIRRNLIKSNLYI